jgi:hypothetical protein
MREVVIASIALDDGEDARHQRLGLGMPRLQGPKER